MTKILLVDDEERFRTSLAKRLRKRGFDVVDVNCGEAAIKTAHQDDAIEIAVIDLKMPDMDGIQTLRELKAFRPALQAVMLTGHGSLDSALSSGKLDAFEYLQKPADHEVLLDTIRRAAAHKAELQAEAFRAESAEVMEGGNSAKAILESMSALREKYEIGK